MLCKSASPNYGPSSGSCSQPHMTEMQQAGELAAWVRPDAMASVLIAVANGLVMQAVIDPNGPTLPAMTSQFGALLLAAREPSG